MSNDETNEPARADTTEPVLDETVGEAAEHTIDESPAETDEALDLVSYDLNDDGTISPLEGARFEIGLVDARMEELAQEPGIKGKLAEAAHHLLDKLDND